MIATDVIVIGDSMLDIHTYIRPVGLAAESEGAVVYVPRREVLQPGGAANVALNCKALGHKTCLFTTIGQDAAGSQLRRELSHRELDYHAAVTATTTVKRRLRTEQNLLLRLDENGSRSKEYELRDLEKPVYERCPVLHTRVAVLVDYDKGFASLAAHHEAFAAALLSGCRPVVIEPSRHAVLEKYKFFQQIFKLNIEQAQSFIRRTYDEDEPVLDHSRKYDRDTYESLCDRLHCAMFKLGVSYDMVVLTLGAGGIVAFRSEDQSPRIIGPICTHLPVFPVVDTCGAGDVVTAVLASFVLRYYNDGKGDGSDGEDGWVELMLRAAASHSSHSLLHHGNYVIPKSGNVQSS